MWLMAGKVVNVRDFALETTLDRPNAAGDLLPLQLQCQFVLD